MSNTSIKLRKLEIKNFKVYKSQQFDFDNNSLVVFDGANGFGKTTIFDAIELLFTGRIRRYIDIKGKLIDGRETRTENPFYCTEGDGSPIEIKAALEYNGNVTYLSRKSPNKENIGAEINFDDFSLHFLDSFDAQANEANEGSEEKLTEILGKHYRSDFEFLHYIEQEDSLYLLKKSEKEKKESIGYLFNTSSFQEKINKFTKIESTINNFHSDLTNEINKLTNEIKVVQESLLTENETSYIALFPEKEFEWDKKEIKFDENEFQRLLSSEKGIIPKISKLVEHKDAFFQDKINRDVDNLLADRDSLEMFCHFGFFSDRIEQLEKEKKIYNYLKHIKEKLVDFDIDNIESGIFDVPEYFKKEIENLIFISEYENKLKSLKRIVRHSDNTSKLLNKLTSSREILLKHQEDYHNQINEDGICQLCGYDWETKDKLLQSLDDQTEALNSLNRELNTELSEELIEFKTITVPEYIKEVEKIVALYLYDPNYFEKDFFSQKARRSITITRVQLTSLKIDYNAYLSKETTFSDENLEKLIEAIVARKKEIDEEAILPYFDDVYLNYFDEKKERLYQFDISRLDEKTKYIKWQYSIFQNNAIKVKTGLINAATEKQSTLKTTLDKTRRILGIQNNSLKKYNAKIINDIELLFHIYSGRIVQDFQGGLGLFIINKNDKIKFVTSPDKTYDAVFSMSNGQLSALIIAFTLALNKKYSSTNLLFVDDPVQSMDDMNTSGFVEVLRNDFNDRQIFISTHEISMSTYVRYKFEKFNLTSKRFDVSSLSV